MVFKTPRLFNSSNDYFHNKKRVQDNRELVRFYLGKYKKYSPEQIKIYLKAYDYFRDNPFDFDGTTMNEDLFDIENLELASMLHDYLYLEYNAAGSLKYCTLSDKLLRSEMTRMNKSTWNRGVRFSLLLFKTLIGYTFYCYIFKKRRMTQEQKNSMDGIITILSYRSPKAWYKEFKGEITWLVIIILSLIFIII